MNKVVYLLLLLLLSCSTGINNQPLTKGVIQNRPEIPVDEKSQVTIDFADIKSAPLDTGLRFTKEICESLQIHLEIAKKKGNYKGLSAAVGVPGVGFWHSAIGESGTEMPLSSETQFHALSLGKIFTSALILKLIEQKHIGLHDTIDRWFSQCPRSHEITIRHLLSHTSGIQTYEALREFVLKDNNDFSEQELVEMALLYEIDSPPDTYFSYSNTGYSMLGIIMREVTGKSLEQLYKDYYIQPLSLNNTSFCSKDNISMNGVRGYDQGTLSDNSEWPLTYAAGPLISTPTELLLLFNHILSGEFLSTTGMNELLKDMNIWKHEPDSYYGKGIYVLKGLPGGDYLGHAGGHDCFRTCLFYHMGRDIFISIFSNSNKTAIEPAMFYLTERLMEIME